MSIFEVQIVSEGRWKSIEAFVDYEAAYECAERIDRKQLTEQLRVCAVDMDRNGGIREQVLYEAGLKARRDRATEKKRLEQDAYRQRIIDRRVHRVTAEDAARQKKMLFSSNSPVYLTLVSLTIGLTGLSALYLVEKAFLS
jgi:hypothetical protein